MPDSSSPETPNTPGTAIQYGGLPHALFDSVTLRPLGFGESERYELLEEIARGGMGIVFRARDRVLNREVGLKTLLKVPPQGSAIASRFREEARITGQLQHPNIPPVHDLGTLSDGRPFLAMKLIKGHTLDAILKDRPDLVRDRGKYLSIFEQIAQGVAYAHSRGVIHRDLKPLNVMVGAFGEVQVVDWGLAKEATGERGGGTEAQGGAPNVDATQFGEVKGTPAYMAPEQARGEPVDARADVFALGGILTVMLTGKPPFIGAGVRDTVLMAARGEIDACFARLDSCGADESLIACCKRCLSPLREQRPADAGEVVRVVQTFLAESEAARQRAEAEGRVLRARNEEAHAAQRRLFRRTVAAGITLISLTLLGGYAFRHGTQDEIREAHERAENRIKSATRKADEKEAERSKESLATRVYLDLQIARTNAKMKMAEAKLEEAIAIQEQAEAARRVGNDRINIASQLVKKAESMSAESWISAGINVLRTEGNVELAVAAFKEAARLDPKSSSAHHNLGLALARKGDLAGAVVAMKKTIQLAPALAVAHHDLGEILRQEVDLDGAVAAYNQAIKLDPKHAAAYNALAWIHATGPDKIRNGDKAFGFASKAVVLAGNDAVLQNRYTETLAAAYAEFGEFKAARSMLGNSESMIATLYGSEGLKRYQLYAKGMPYRDPLLARLPLAPPPRKVTRP
jgi:serine/threonine protein kinase